MTRAYCTRCGAERDTASGHCPDGHRVAIDRPGYVGRHRARVAVPRMQVLEVLGFADHGTNSITQAAPTAPVRPRIPSTPRRSSRPVGRHRYGSTPTTKRDTDITRFTLDAVDTKPTENTGVLVERLWEASDDTMADVETWHGPTVEADTGPGRRRWPWIMAALSVTAAVLAIWLLPNIAEERNQAIADEVSAEVEAAAVDLRRASSVAATIIDPASDTAVLSGMAVDLTRIDTAARSLLDQAVAAEDADLDIAVDIGQAGQLALNLERRLSTVLTYRLIIESALTLPELPASVPSEDLGAVARQLSEAITSIQTDVV